jgi:hypothetical protein
MAEQRLEREGSAYEGTNGRQYSAPKTKSDADAPGDATGTEGVVAREFSLKSFKCFARQHPLLVGFGAAGIGAAVATLGAGYVLYRGAQSSLPGRALRVAKLLVTF